MLFFYCRPRVITDHPCKIPGARPADLEEGHHPILNKAGCQLHGSVRPWDLEFYGAHSFRNWMERSGCWSWSWRGLKRSRSGLRTEQQFFAAFEQAMFSPSPSLSIYIHLSLLLFLCCLSSRWRRSLRSMIAQKMLPGCSKSRSA